VNLLWYWLWVLVVILASVSGILHSHVIHKNLKISKKWEWFTAPQYSRLLDVTLNLGWYLVFFIPWEIAKGFVNVGVAQSYTLLAAVINLVLNLPVIAFPILVLIYITRKTKEENS
jgi:hypothetical protein